MVPDPYSIPQGCALQLALQQSLPGVCESQEPPIMQVGPKQWTRCCLYAGRR